jgi:hypothetical protein
MLDTLGTGVAIAPERTDAQPPLGRLLVERGLLSEEQLQFALSEHARTGLPLGQVLISLSYVTATTIAQALATQQGGLVHTEYGFATGFSPDQAMAAPLSLPPVSPPPTTGVAPSWTQAESAQQIAQAFPAPFPAPLPAAVVEAAVLQAAPAPPPQGPELAEASTRIMSLELELAAARQETEVARQDAGLARQEMLAANAAGEELATARTRIAELEGETTLTRSALDEASRKIESLEQAALAVAAGSGEAELHQADLQQAQAELQQTQAQLASTTENLRAAYERLHQFEIAQALQQHPQARAASPFAWQS